MTSVYFGDGPPEGDQQNDNDSKPEVGIEAVAKWGKAQPQLAQA